MRQTTKLIAAADHQPNILSTNCYCFNQEPTLADLFGDPIMQSMLIADRVEITDLCALLNRARHFGALAGNWTA